MAHSVDQMLKDVLRREGGFVNHRDDKGGATNMGITIGTLSRYLGRAATIGEVKNLRRDTATTIYKQNYLFGPGIDDLPNSIVPFAFDSAVNHGPRRAIRFVQAVCNAAGFGPLSVDGAMGPQTKGAADKAEQAMGLWFLAALAEERRSFYKLIVERKPSQQVFFDGWMNRLAEFDVPEESLIA